MLGFFPFAAHAGIMPPVNAVVAPATPRAPRKSRRLKVLFLVVTFHVPLYSLRNWQGFEKCMMRYWLSVTDLRQTNQPYKTRALQTHQNNAIGTYQPGLDAGLVLCVPCVPSEKLIPFAVFQISRCKAVTDIELIRIRMVVAQTEIFLLLLICGKMI